MAQKKSEPKPTSLFWADQMADQVIERVKNKIATVRSGQTPSGGKHIGNLNDPVRAYFVCKSIIDKGHKARFVNTSDDRYPLKDVPSRISDLDGNWFDSGKFPILKKYLGQPIVRVPDPFGCCKSYADHFAKLWSSGLYLIGIRPEEYTNDQLYKEGKFDPYIRKVFERRQLVGELCNKFQESKSKDYIPFDAICPNCGVLANISGFDLKSKKVEFTCGGKAIKKKKSEGCGHQGEVLWSEGKLQWRFEWPAQWAIFDTDFEPFGKDHAEGSWKSGQEISKKVYDFEPLIPFVYEFFLVNGEKMSASKGNVYIVQDMMKILEPEIFLYYYTKRPGKQRDLDLKNVNLLVDEFEKLEEAYFKGGEGKEFENIERMYKLSWGKSVPEKKPLRIPYTYAALISQTTQKDNFLERALSVLKDTGHITTLSEEEKKHVEMRLLVAKNWVDLYADERHKVSLRTDFSDIKLSAKEKEVVRDFVGRLSGKPYKEDEFYPLFKEVAESNGIDTKEFFRIIYNVLVGRDSGPRLNSFILAIGQDKVIEILRRV